MNGTGNISFPLNRVKMARHKDSKNATKFELPLNPIISKKPLKPNKNNIARLAVVITLVIDNNALIVSFYFIQILCYLHNRY